MREINKKQYEDKDYVFEVVAEDNDMSMHLQRMMAQAGQPAMAALL